MYLFCCRATQVPRQKLPRRARPIIEEENLIKNLGIMKNLGKWMFALSIGVFAGSAALADGYKLHQSQQGLLETGNRG
jgi:hypothetical protein